MPPTTRPVYTDPLTHRRMARRRRCTGCGKLEDPELLEADPSSYKGIDWYHRECALDKGICTDPECREGSCATNKWRLGEECPYAYRRAERDPLCDAVPDLRTYRAFYDHLDACHPL